MADFTINLPDPWVPRVMEWVDIRAEQLNTHPVIINKGFPEYGVTDLMDLTPLDRARVIVKFELYSGVRTVERKAAGLAAENAAKDDVDDNFPIET